MTQPIHTIKLTNAAASELATLVTGRGLITDEKHLLRVSKFARKYLRNLPQPPTDPKDSADWAETEFAAVEVKEKTRDSLKELVKAAAGKGALCCNFGAGDLLEILGLAEADE